MKTLKVALPVMLGYLPVGMTFGLLSNQEHMSLAVTMGLSAFIFAGAAQFVALSFLALSSFNLPQVFLTIWLVNLRHFILSLAYLPNTTEWSLWGRLKFFPFLTDETFAVLFGSEVKKDSSLAFRVSFFNYLTWNLGTFIGYFGGNLIPDPKIWGLDFALTALFIALITLFLKKQSHWITFISSIVLTLIFYSYLGLGKNSIIVAALMAATLGWLWERRQTS